LAEEGYLDALGKKRTAEVKRDGTIGEAEATRDAKIKSAEAMQEGEKAKFDADGNPTECGAIAVNDATGEVAVAVIN